MSQWYYMQNGQQQGPISGDQLKSLAAGGGLVREDLVWKEGMANWVRAAEVNGLAFAAAAPAPFVAGAPAAAQPPYAPIPTAAPVDPSLLGYYAPTGKGDVNLNRRGLEMLRQTKPWVRFMSVIMFILAGFMVVGGAFLFIATAMANVRTPIGVVPALAYLALGLLYVVPAIYLGRYASAIRTLLASNQDQHLSSALEAQKSFWKFVGIMTAVVLGLYVLAALVAVLFVGMR